MNDSLGVYVHIPFCAKRCSYCDFYSGADQSRYEEYEKALFDHISQFKGLRADTVYFGGGTPTFFGADRLCRLLEKIKDTFVLQSNSEITAECNPKTVSKNGLLMMKQSGFNRLSIGVQSAMDSELEILGRIHTVCDAKNVIEQARTVGFDNISVDLMYGIPNQTIDTFKKSLEFAVAMQAAHVSAYILKLEEGTPMYQNRFSLSFPNEDEICEMTEICHDYLEKNGLYRYEISNYSEKGKESRHNLKYWHRGQYVSFGPSASSFYNGRRYTYAPDMNAYIAFCKGEKKEKDALCEEEFPNSVQAEAEYLMLALRLTEGVNKSDYKKRFSKDFDNEYGKAITPFVKGGFMHDGENVRFTHNGFNVSNTILAEILKFE